MLLTDLDTRAADCTVHAVLQAVAQRQPQADLLFTEDVTAAQYGIAPGTVSYGQALATVAQWRQAYQAAGYGHGHRVGLLLDNRPDFLYHWWALNALGVSVVPIHSDMRSAELQYLIDHSEIVLAVVLPNRVADVSQAAQAVGSDAAVWAHGSDAPLPPAARLAPSAAQAPGRDSECALLYTSGTTGRPKGCRLLNGYFLAAGQWYADLGGACVTRPAQERVITPLPLNHMNAMAFSTMVVLLTGGCLVQLDRFHPQTWWQSVAQSRATVVHYLGVMPAMLLSAPAQASDRAHAVRFGFGAGVDQRNHAPFEARFGFPLVEAWAMTETGAAACVMANDEPRHVGTRCFGKPPSEMAYCLVDDQGVDVGVGVPGELWVRAQGPNPRQDFFAGYLKDAQATEEAWAGGWFHTGDLVQRDAQGLLYFVDRKKNVIRRSGENISAVEVESVLAQHPAVKACAIAATPDAVRGDEVLACVVTREALPAAQRAALAQDLVRHCLDQLAYYKAPGYVAFVEALPVTLSQKVQRGQLRDVARDLPGQAHCIDVRALKKRQA